MFIIIVDEINIKVYSIFKSGSGILEHTITPEYKYTSTIVHYGYKKCIFSSKLHLI